MMGEAGHQRDGRAHGPYEDERCGQIYGIFDYACIPPVKPGFIGVFYWQIPI